jgi:hyperosmotically inducible protein
MKTKFAMTCVAVGTLLGAAVAMAADKPDSTHPVTYVKDSAITTDIKAKLAAEHLTSLERIHVDTDTGGMVWLSGSASTREAADKAASIARNTDGVTKVHSDIKVMPSG